MKITLGQSYSFRQQGRRDYQEDSRFPDMDKPTPKQRFFVVCDGVGGCEKGEVASRTVCDAIAKAMENVEYDMEFTNSDFSVVLDAAYDALDKKADRSNRDMATTFTFAYFHGGGCTLAHIGDSRIYHFRKGKGVIYRSEDHSLVNSMVHNGMITPEEGMNSSPKHIITRYMEPVDSDQNRCMATVLNTKDVRKGDYIMLCTDGVCNQVDDDEMADILFNSEMSDENKMSMIAQMCIESDDNNTAILIPIIDVVTDKKSAEPADSNEGTKKFPFSGESTIVEIESSQQQKGNRYLNWIKEIFNKKNTIMKKFFIIIILVTFSVAIVNAAPAKKKQPKAKVEKVDSIALMIDKADKGDAKAQNTVGVWYYTGKDSLRQDYKKALQYWALSAKQDNIDAIGNMAMCYQLGRGTKKDSTMAVNLYKAALKKGSKTIIPQHETIVKNTGSLFSSLLLKECYKDGIGTKKDIQKYVYYMEQAANKQDVTSQYELALYYLNNQQADKAVTWFKKAAKQGEVGATYYYGYLMFNGQGMVQDKKGGIKLLQSAADKDFTMAFYQLGRIYYEGDGTDQDYKKAVDYLRKAAERKNYNAKWLLGMCYLNGNGVKQDYYFATQLIADATPSHQKEFKQLLADDKDGTFTDYLYGLKKYYVEKDYDSAISYFKKVDKAKNVAGKTMLAVCYGNKDYAKRNVKKAIKTLNKVSGNCPTADYYLSSMLETGTGADADEKRALSLLENAANNGVAYAQCKLGDKCMTGNGVTKDLSKAAKLYLQAEAQGHLTPESAKNLAECYVKKIGILPDLANAEKRIEELKKYKQNDSLVTLLKSIK